MFSTALTVLLAIPFVARAVLADNECTRTYTVQIGDTCDSISAAQHVSSYQLAVVNHGIINDLCTNLVPGQAICLGHHGEDCTDTYVVVQGDTCDGISTHTSVPLDILYLNNPQINDYCTNIHVGEVLCVAKDPTVPDDPEDCEDDDHGHGHGDDDDDDDHHHDDDDDEDCEDDDDDHWEDDDEDDHCEDDEDDGHEEEDDDCEDDDDDHHWEDDGDDNGDDNGDIE